MKGAPLVVVFALTAMGALAACETSPNDGAAQESPIDADAHDGQSDGAMDGGDASGPDVADATADAYFEGSSYVLEGSHANVIRRILFTAESAPGVADGFDLDERVSERGDEQSCGHGDLVAPDGRVGIDNQFAKLWGAIQPIVGEQVEGLLQGAINEGRVLVMAELAGVDDLRNDDDVTFNLYRAILDPDVGTFGLISPSQTFYFDYDTPVSTAENVAIVDGRVIAGPVRLDLPINILELNIIMPLENAFVRFDIAEDGTFVGIMAGGIHVPTVIEALLDTPAAQETELVAPFFENNADMQRVDGECQVISATFGFEGTTAFVVRDAARESAND